MSIAAKIEYIKTSDLCLDPRNPRLRADQQGGDQDALLDVMSDWGLDELATSIVESSFWPHEALIVVDEKLKGRTTSKVVVEGNRRLAAVTMLLRAYDGQPTSPKWKSLAGRLSTEAALHLRSLPTITADQRSDVDAFLGFRHVTGIKQWDPLEKAAFIAKLIDGGMTYEEVMRKIGSKTPSVRQNYIALKLFQQLEDIEDIDSRRIREKFSVLFLSLRSVGTQSYLGLNLELDPKKAARPLHSRFVANAIRFARWLFGDAKHEPLFTDSRHTDSFGNALANKEARAYLERTENPRLEVALRLAGGDREELIRQLGRAADEIEDALSIVQHHAKNGDVIRAYRRLAKDFATLKANFPDDEE